MKKAKVMRFKEWGKWYETIEIDIPDSIFAEPLFKIWEWLRKLKDNNMHDANFHWVIDIPDHQDNQLKLLISTDNDIIDCLTKAYQIIGPPTDHSITSDDGLYKLATKIEETLNRIKL